MVVRAECGQYECELSALIDGELSAARREVIQAHVSACGACRALVHTLQTNRDELFALPRVRAPESLAMFIRQRAERRALFGDAEWVPRGRFWLWFARISASAALVFAGAFVSWRLFVATRVPEVSPGGRSAVVENQRTARAIAGSEDIAGGTGEQPRVASGVESGARPFAANAGPHDAGAVAEPTAKTVAIVAEDTIAVTCAPANEEQYALVLAALRQHVAAALMERTMRVSIAPRLPGSAGDVFDARIVEFEEPLDGGTGVKIRLRIPASSAPTMLAMFEQAAPKCVRVNVPWSRRDQIAQVLFAQNPPIEPDQPTTGSKEVLAQTLETWLTRELANLNREARRLAASQPNKLPAAIADGGREESSAWNGVDENKRSQDSERLPAPAVIGDVEHSSGEFRVPESLARIPKMVYNKGGALVQSLFGALMESPAPATKIDAVILELELLAPYRSDAD
ncbi:MAG: zf-HC2 domain-containing protein [Phycisphaerales bacterium]|nr:zf-HC2 domain-containing protein [Phycisphaerales bacterium]